ncbi:hypothetical protein EUGRSUZ_B02413 [Eucalyptus grandis]|uniref:Uncharacterized protein n=2 Tax=Eucalyptus grandis TaxID=71139 RepID=A0ACC3LUQ3_EUCGR|nr:hypothetical protein EUGRSUZ_B02413 [Eucalyptus grandis]
MKRVCKLLRAPRPRKWTASGFWTDTGTPPTLISTSGQKPGWFGPGRAPRESFQFAGNRPPPAPESALHALAAGPPSRRCDDGSGGTSWPTKTSADPARVDERRFYQATDDEDSAEIQQNKRPEKLTGLPESPGLRNPFFFNRKYLRRDHRETKARGPDWCDWGLVMHHADGGFRIRYGELADGDH